MEKNNKVEIYQELISDVENNYNNFVDRRLQSKLFSYLKKTKKQNPIFSILDIEEKDKINIYNSFIKDKVKNKNYKIGLDYEFIENDGLLNFIKKLNRLLENKKNFRAVWRDHKNIFIEAMESIFISNTNKYFSREELSRTFLKNDNVKIIDLKSGGLLSKMISIDKGAGVSNGYFKISDLINCVKKRMREREISKGYIIGKIESLDTKKIIDGENVQLSEWKYTEDWIEIMEYCHKSGSAGARRYFANLLFIDKNHEFGTKFSDNLESIDSVMKIVDTIIIKKYKK